MHELPLLWRAVPNLTTRSLELLMSANSETPQLARGRLLLFARGVKTVNAQEAALLTLPEAILNPFWVWLLWSEPVPLSTWIGGSLILGGLALRYVALPIRT